MADQPVGSIRTEEKRNSYADGSFDVMCEYSFIQDPTSNPTTGILIGIAWYWHKFRHVNQSNKNEDPDINPRTNEHLKPKIQI